MVVMVNKQERVKMSLKKQWLDMLKKVLGVMKEIEKENIKAYHWLDNLDPAT